MSVAVPFDGAAAEAVRFHAAADRQTRLLDLVELEPLVGETTLVRPWLLALDHDDIRSPFEAAASNLHSVQTLDADGRLVDSHYFDYFIPAQPGEDGGDGRPKLVGFSATWPDVLTCQFVGAGARPSGYVVRDEDGRLVDEVNLEYRRKHFATATTHNSRRFGLWVDTREFDIDGYQYRQTIRHLRPGHAMRDRLLRPAVDRRFVRGRLQPDGERPLARMVEREGLKWRMVVYHRHPSGDIKETGTFFEERSETETDKHGKPKLIRNAQQLAHHHYDRLTGALRARTLELQEHGHVTKRLQLVKYLQDEYPEEHDPPPRKHEPLVLKSGEVIPLRRFA